MTKQFTKVFALMIIGMIVCGNVCAQTITEGDHDHGLFDPSLKGSEWGLFHFPKMNDDGSYVMDGDKNEFESFHYYLGGTFDRILVEKFKGGHWKGHLLEELGENEEIYLCNVATGEYLQVGDYWGQTSMTNHVGLSYKLEKGTSSRAGWALFQNDKQGYWICPVLPESQSELDHLCIGRMHSGDGKAGHFERNRYFALRQEYEYHDDKSGQPTHPGGFLFQFHPVIHDGKQCYIIYTHRRTEYADGTEDFGPGNRGTKIRSEFWDRESYLLIQSAGQLRSGYNTVRFKKFAGQMYGKHSAYNQSNLTFGDDRDNPLQGETDYYDPANGKELKYVPIGDGKLDNDNEIDGLYMAAADENNLWKIVTKKERDRFRHVASENQPVDVTHYIKNPKFYTSYNYAWAKGEDCTWDGSHWLHGNTDANNGWKWFDDDRLPHEGTQHHVHPWDLKVGVDNGIPATQEEIESTRPEYHKIGTGFFYRYMTKDQDPVRKEHYITLGNDANYVGSIWKGTGNLQQSITGLREGLYIVCVKGFYAPHDMMNYDMEDDRSNPTMTMGGTASSATSAAPTDWKDQAVVNVSGTNKWRRSFDSYLFAWSSPEGTREEVRRMLPSIYEGAVKGADLKELSKEGEPYTDSQGNTVQPFLTSEDFLYTEVGVDPVNKYKNEYKYMKDRFNLAKFGGSFFGSGGGGTNWFVPKSLAGAGRWFNAAEGVDVNASNNTTYANTAKYRIALPVYVGKDGNLTIGVDHTRIPSSTKFEGTIEYIDENGEPKEREVEHTIPASFPNEWVCFDDFELIYLGKVEPDEFVVDENHYSSKADYNVPSRTKTNGSTGEEDPSLGVSNGGQAVRNMNNTQYIDIFDADDIEIEGKDHVTIKTLVIRRTLTKDGFSSIVLPVSLTYEQVKEGFGDGVQISRLDDFTGHTIMYKAVQEGANDNDIVMHAGIPYVIKPSIDPIVPAPTKNSSGVLESPVKYTRPAFTVALSTKGKNIAGYYLRDEKRNYEVETSMFGPIYIINKVDVKAGETFPDVVLRHKTQAEIDAAGSGTLEDWVRNTEDYTTETLAEQDKTWAVIKPFSSKNPSNTNPRSSTAGGKNKTYYIKGKENLGKFELVEDATYYGGQQIPANSYFHSNGKMYYTTVAQNTTKGMYAYLQMKYADGVNQGDAYSKPFIGGPDFFVEVLGETSGVEEVNAPKPDGKIEIYDLMGRKVNNPRPGGFYIMNGIKVLWK